MLFIQTKNQLQSGACNPATQAGTLDDVLRSPCPSRLLPNVLVKRRHGLNRSRYKNIQGMKRRVDLGVMADNLINIGLHLASKR